jgi:hypothetical protein
MVTHIDTIAKKNKLQKSLESAALGICMSKHHMMELVELGISNTRLSYINPAHDNVGSPRPIIIGIATRMYPDGRKREQFVEKLIDTIDSKIFSFKIMGNGWDSIVKKMKSKNFQVHYFPEFEQVQYHDMLKGLDYYLYTGTDEGQIGVIDALSVGIKTIVPPVGYHLDLVNGVTHPFMSFDELKAVFHEISNERTKLIASVSDWTWRNYALKHLEIWDYLIARGKKTKYLLPARKYQDGVFSVSEFQTELQLTKQGSHAIVLRLWLNYLLHKMNYFKNIIKSGEVISTFRKINLRRIRNFFFKY